MPSTVVLITSILSILGFAINILVMLVILSRGRRKHHLLFAPLLLIGACWDLGIFLIMIRNSFPDEIIQYQNLITIPIGFLPAFFYHFTSTYLNQPRKKTTIALYAYCIFGFVLVITGIFKPVSGVFNYAWGTVARYEPNWENLSWILVTYLTIFVSCWLLFQAQKQASSPLARRHIRYILVSFIVFSVAHLKILVVYGLDVAFLLPLGMFLIDSFGALIGIAIIKDQLFDITVLVRKGIIYSSLAILIIFIFDFSQHLLAMFLGELAGGHSIYIHFTSIGIVVIAFMPLKRKLEQTIGNILAKKTIEF